MPAGLTGVAQVSAGGDQTVALRAVSVSSNMSAYAAGFGGVGHVTVFLPVAPKLNSSVAISSDSLATSVPSSVIVPAGQHSVTFLASVGTGISAGYHLIGATYQGAKSYASYLALTLGISPLVFAMNPTTGGATTSGTVSVNVAAPASGIVVQLTSNNPHVVVPTSVTITAGHSSAVFTVKTTSVSVNTVVSITATTGTVSRTSTLTVKP